MSLAHYVIFSEFYLVIVKILCRASFPIKIGTSRMLLAE
jgi:hypothetical protein